MPATADDRIAFVIDTEAHLDGIVAARSEVRGLGVDSEQSAVKMAAASRVNAQATADQMSPMSKILAGKAQLVDSEEKLAKSTATTTATTVAATRNMGMWAALQAESSGHVGKHSLALGRLERNLAGVAEKAVGANASIGLMSTSLLKFGIGTIETVGILAGIAAITAAYHFLTDEANKAEAADIARARTASLEHLKTFTVAGIGRQLSEIQAARQAAIDAMEKGGTFDEFIHRKRVPGEGIKEDIADLFSRSSGGERSFAKLDELYAAAIVRAKELERAERLRAVAMRDQRELQIALNDRQIEGLSAAQDIRIVTTRQTYELYTQQDLEEKRIRASFRRRDDQGHIVEMTAAERKEMETLLDQNKQMTDLKARELRITQELAEIAYRRTVATMTAANDPYNPVARYQERLAAIQEEADADIRAGRDRVDVEAMTQQKIRALRRETAKQAMDDARTISGVLLASGSKDVRAIGHAAESIRRVIIGAQAAHAAVESAIEGGKAIGSLAAMDFRGAALHGAAALELAKAAALGAQESLGGGRGASGGGGSAGGGGGTTFEPRSGTEGTGSVVVNLYSQNPYGAEQIQQIKWNLERADILKRPGIQIAPTNGIRAA